MKQAPALKPDPRKLSRPTNENGYEIPSGIQKTRYAFRENVASFVSHFGVEHCGFLTLTFAEHVTDVREASRRFNSFRTGILSEHTLGYIGVYERTKKGRIHFHFLVAFEKNIRQGTRFDKCLNMHLPTSFNFVQAKKGIYVSAPDSLREIWAILRKTLTSYGFGIQHRLVPVQDEKGVSGYLAKYLVKGLETRKPEDKGFRFVRSTIGKKAYIWRCVLSRFAWHSSRAKRFRSKFGEVLTDISLYLMKKHKDVKGWTLKFNQNTYSKLAYVVMGAKWGYWVSMMANSLIEEEIFNREVI